MMIWIKNWHKIYQTYGMASIITIDCSPLDYYFCNKIIWPEVVWPESVLRNSLFPLKMSMTKTGIASKYFWKFEWIGYWRLEDRMPFSQCEKRKGNNAKKDHQFSYFLLCLDQKNIQAAAVQIITDVVRLPHLQDM